MKTDSRALRPLPTAALLVFAALLAVGSPVWPQTPKKPATKPAPGSPAPKPASAPPAGSAQPVLQDRVLAVVDEDPVLASDVERAIRLGLEQPKPGEDDARFHRRVLDALIDQRLQFHEIDRFNFEQVPVDDIQKRVAEIRSRFPDDAAFQKALKEVGLDLKALRQLVARQLLVLTYVDERLGSRVFVGPDEINRYYREVLTPEMSRQGRQPPLIEDVREDIRETLKQQKMTQEMVSWTQDLRKKADMVYSAAQPVAQPLPPVVKTIQGKKAEPKPEAKKPAPAGRKPPR
jgi:peptidyl-prolyl cis-trans isomerase SurA